MKKKTLKLHADFYKIFSNPGGLSSSACCDEGELTAGEITEKLGASI